MDGCDHRVQPTGGRFHPSTIHPCIHLTKIYVSFKDGPPQKMSNNKKKNIFKKSTEIGFQYPFFVWLPGQKRQEGHLTMKK